MRLLQTATSSLIGVKNRGWNAPDVLYPVDAGRLKIGCLQIGCLKLAPVAATESRLLGLSIFGTRITIVKLYQLDRMVRDMRMEALGYM